MQRRLRKSTVIATAVVAIGLAMWAANTWRHAKRSPLASPATNSPAQGEHEDNPGPRFIRGVVRDGRRPVANATVRIQGTTTRFQTDEKGHFHFAAPIHAPGAVSVSVSKPGYFITTTSWKTQPISVALRSIPNTDNLKYEWVDPRPNEASEQNCGNCHQQIFDDWKSSGHAASAQNSRFLDLYRGTNARGKHGHGWDFLADYPGGRDVCAACHAPGAGFERGDSLDMRRLQSPQAEQRNHDHVTAQGVHCDYCHKIQAIREPLNGLAHGRFGVQLLRPHEGQLFFGPWDDANRDDNVFSSVQKSSKLCATCHEGTVFGVHVYTTYSEWLNSPAAEAGRECQSCHMASQGHTNVAPGHGGVDRDPAQVSSHSMMPGGAAQMMRSAIHLQAQVVRTERQTTCVVDITTRDVGHKVPTGFIDRHLLLVIDAQAKDGQRVRLPGGSTLPMAAGDLAGREGMLFARLATDEAGQPQPFWKSDTEYKDTRLSPETTKKFSWSLPATVDRVTVRLLYRRFWHAVTQSKGWTDDTLQLYERTVKVGPGESPR